MWQNFEKLNKNDLFFEKLMFDLRTSWVNLANLRKLNLQKINELIELWYLEFKRKELILTDKWILILDYILKEII
jgi:coproporphyrinogen III oxidase-like Fe-S oxidoreductase